ncbi:MAG TPA: DUF3108 domain-containing protein [Williamwhitmania sp.]|nr:DUF3108 domain-containing protein [Williamwhitmania sp.]
MERRFWLRLFCLLWAVGLTFSAAAQVDSLNPAFQVGETLRYKISFGFLDVGTADMRVYLASNGDDPVYFVKAEARTDALANKLFTIYDVYESYIDISTGLPVKSIRDISENNYRYYNEVSFMRSTKQVFSSRSGVHSVPDSILDILSAFYYARRFALNKLVVDQKVGFITYFADEVFKFEMVYKGIEMVKTAFGWIECQKFVPIVQLGRLFRKKDAVVFYITNDANRLPVKIQMRMFFSSVEVNLEEFYGLSNSMSVYKNKKRKNSKNNMPEQFSGSDKKPK